MTASAGVRIDWDEDGFGTGSHDDVTSDVMSWTITRGAAAEITGQAQPGSATLRLRRVSRDGLYSPLYSSGALYGKLVDGKRVHVAVNQDGTVSGAGTVSGLFAGRITDLTVVPSEGSGHAPITEITCEDPLGWYGRTAITVADSRTRSQGALRLAILTALGESRYSLESEIATLPLSSADSDALSALSAINAANGSRHFAKPAADYANWYAYTAYNRQHGLSGTAAGTVDAGAQHVTSTDGWRVSADTVINQQKASVEPIQFLDAARIVWTHDALPLVATGTVTIWATFPDYVDAPTIEYETTGSALTSITMTPFGRSAKIVIVSSGTTTFTMLRIRGYEVVRGDGQSVVINDATSQSAPRGIRSGQEISGPDVGVLAMARGIASHVVWRYATPQLRPTLTVENWYPSQFTLDLFDVIAVTASQFDASARHFEIIGLTHVSDLAAATVQHHVTTYVLQECRVQSATAWFRAGVSVSDGTDILAY